MVEVWSKFRANFDTGGVEVWCQSLVDSWSNTLTLECVSFISRANFDQTSTLGVPRFGRSLVEMWSTFIPKLDHTSTPVSKLGRNFYQSSTPTSIYNFDSNKIYMFDSTVFAILINRYSHNFEQQIFTILSNKYSQFWINNIHTFDQNIYTILTKQYSQFLSYKIIILTSK